MGKEIKAVQRNMIRSAIMIQRTLAVRRPFKPEASLLNILWRPVPKSPGEHSLRTSAGLFLVSHLIAEEDEGREGCPHFTLCKH